jgi:hypothetical protein
MDLFKPTSSHGTTVNSHSAIHYSTHLSLLSLPVFLDRLPTADDPLLLDSLVLLVPQLPASKSSSSQELNHSKTVTHSLTHQPTHSTPLANSQAGDHLTPTSSSSHSHLKTQDSRLCCSQSQSYVMTDSQSASLSWCQAPNWGLQPDFYYCQIVAGLLMWGILSYKRTGLLFTITAGSHQHSHSWV